MYLSKEQKEKIKIIAFDLDGTLLNRESRLSDRTREVLEAAAEKGYHIVPATGRVYTALPKDLETVRGWDYAVTSNGAHVMRVADDTAIYESLIEWDAIEPVVSALMDDSVICEIFFGGRGYIGEKSLLVLDDFVPDARRQEYIRTTRKPVPDLEALMREHRDELENIMLLFADSAVKEQYFEYLDARPGLNVVFSQKYSFEIGGADTSKANGLRELARLLGLSAENIISFGDSTNDIAMLKASGVSVAMGNAIEPVKEAADIVAPPNWEDGLAAVVAELLE